LRKVNWPWRIGCALEPVPLSCAAANVHRNMRAKQVAFRSAGGSARQSAPKPRGSTSTTLDAPRRPVASPVATHGSNATRTTNAQRCCSRSGHHRHQNWPTTARHRQQSRSQPAHASRVLCPTAVLRVNGQLERASQPSPIFRGPYVPATQREGWLPSIRIGRRTPTADPKPPPSQSTGQSRNVAGIP